MTKKNTGFTLVELMVVIATLAVLFTIVVLSYGNWRETTATREVSNDLKAAATAMRNYQTYNDVFPTTIPSSFSASPDVTVTYASGNASSFCLNGSSTVITSVQFKITNTTNPVAGSC